MRRPPEKSQRGFTLLEEILCLAIVAVVVAGAMSLLATTARVRSEAQPGAESVWTRSRAQAELARAESAGCSLAYFDVTDTVAAALGKGKPKGGGHEGGGGTEGDKKGEGGGDGGGSPGGKGGGGTAAPDGYCGPVVPSDPSTWPPNFDPTVQSTWKNVTWYPGLDKSDPSTWFYSCATTPATPRAPKPVYSYGTGVVYDAGAGGKPVAIVGPAAVAPESEPLFDGQKGDALVMIKSEPGFAPFVLDGQFATTGGVIRFATSDERQSGAVQALAANDVLVVTGRTNLGEHATAIAQLTEAPHRIEQASYADPDGNPMLEFYEAPIAAPDATFAWGLTNSAATAHGTTIEPDASVTLLDRDEGVVAFYTAEAGDGKELTLYKVVGALSGKRADRERLVEHASSALSAELTTTTTASGTDMPASVTASIAVAPVAGEPAEVVHVRARFLTGAGVNGGMGFMYGTFPSPVTFPATGITPITLESPDE